jgi:lipopolysaccharide/colanic/teichoic acid biosynthesis glycosyltransferase
MERALDIIAVLVLIVMMAPLILFIASLLVAIDVGLPLASCQQRPGIRGRPFKLYKFRTMAAVHDRLTRDGADHDRMSVVGRLLRRTRLDELPQLFNILRGEMSFVGPRRWTII